MGVIISENKDEMRKYLKNIDENNTTKEKLKYNYTFRIILLLQN